MNCRRWQPVTSGLLRSRSSAAVSQARGTDAMQFVLLKIGTVCCAGLACAKYLVDAGHKPIVLEARDCLGFLACTDAFRT